MEEIVRKVVRPAYTGLSESDLLKRVECGDEIAFQELFNRAVPKVINKLVAQHFDKDLAEDVAQDAVLTLWRKRNNTIENEAGFLSLLFKVAHDRMVDHLRRTGRTQKVLKKWIAQELCCANQVDPDETPLEQAETRAKVEKEVSKLSPRWQQVIHAHYWEDQSYQEIANSLETTVETVKAILFRARVTLKNRFVQKGLIASAALVAGLDQLSARVPPILSFPINKKTATILLASLALAGLGYAAYLLKRDASKPEIVDKIAVPVVAVDPETIERQRFDRIVAQVAPKIEGHLQQIAFGPGGGAKLREVFYNPKAPRMDFDWWHGGGKNNQPAPMQFIVTARYSAIADAVIVTWRRNAADPESPPIKPDQTLIWEIKEIGLKVPIPSKRVRDVFAEMEVVRAEYVRDRERLDQAIQPVIPRVEQILQALAIGNEGSARLRRIWYRLDQPRVDFEWRHREVREGKVIFDQVQQIEFMYVPDVDYVIVLWRPSPEGATKQFWPWNSLEVLPGMPQGTGTVDFAKSGEALKLMEVLKMKYAGSQQ